MASLVLLLSEVFRRETPDLLLAGGTFPASPFSAAALKGKQVTAFSSLASKKPSTRSPQVVRAVDEVDAEEDPSEMKVAIDMVWS